MIVASLRREDLASAIRFLEQARVSVGGWTHNDIYRAICASRHSVTVVARLENVARQESSVTGIALVELSRAWLYWHPWLAFRIVCHRWMQSRQAGSHNAEDVATGPGTPFRSGPPPVPWSKPGPRVIFIGVDASCRGQGIGKQLYEEMFAELRRRGYRLLRARIATDNFASLELHHRTGWDLYDDHGVVTALRPLDN